MNGKIIRIISNYTLGLVIVVILLDVQLKAITLGGGSKYRQRGS